MVPYFFLFKFIILKVSDPLLFQLFFFYNFKTQYQTLLTFQITPKIYTIPHYLNNSPFSFHPNMALPLKTSFHLFTSLFQFEILFQSTYLIFFFLQRSIIRLHKSQNFSFLFFC